MCTVGYFMEFETQTFHLLQSLKDEGFDISDEVFLDWLNTPNQSFNGLTPFEKAQTLTGLLEIKLTVQNLQHGIFA